MARRDETGSPWALAERLRTAIGAIGDSAPHPRPFHHLDVGEIEVWSARSTTMRHRRWAVGGLIVASGLLGGALVMRADDHMSRPGGSSPTSDPTATERTLTSTESPTTSAPTTGPAATIAVPAPLAVMPDGILSLDPSIQAIELAIEPGSVADAAGTVVLRYELQVSGAADLDARAGHVVVPPVTEDGELALAADCPTETDCTSISALNGSVGFTIPLIVSRTSTRLTDGQHDGRFSLNFDNGSELDFNVFLLANPLPSATFSEQVRASVGPLVKVQTVAGLGRFGYHAISAFDSIWVLARLSGTVARIDAVTGALLATIDVGGPGAGGLNRLAASDDAIYVSGKVVRRIDPADNTVSELFGPHRLALAVIAAGRTVWVGGYDSIERLDSSGVFTVLGLPDEPWMDLAVSNGLVWALSQASGRGRLIAFDGATGEIRFDLPVAHDVSGFAVRLVADERSVVVGVDTSGGGGRAGELLIVDPVAGVITDTVPLPSRPEGIELTDAHIWTNGAVVDRTTLAVTEVPLGFTITRGPDGSIWGISAGTTASRYAPGDYAG